MKVSKRIIEKLTGLELPPIGELVERINSQLGGVEEVIDLGERYKDAKIVKIVECEKHPDADKLSVCKIDAGDNDLVQVVCGAPNAHAEMWAVWLPPASIVPSTFSDDEPFVLGARELRGVMSHGMLAAGDELAINSDHEGIIEITESDLPDVATLRAGDSFAATFGLDDTIIDIENKMFTHRPDLFGQLGVAREIAGIFGKKFNSPDWYRLDDGFASGDGLSLRVFNDATEKVPRFMAVAIKNIKIKPSPLWLQCRLVAMGGKPINNIVDATNYVMLMTAQPVHAYDHDRLRGQALGVRLAKEGEALKLINDKTYQLSADDLVIVDGEGPVGLAGVMGGGDSEVSAETKNIVLEVATFDMYAVRKTSMRHGLFTDALTRFNKGQSPLQNAAILRYLMMLIDGEQASEVFDLADGERRDLVQFEVATEFICQRLGASILKKDMAQMLQNVEFQLNDGDDDVLRFTVPFWRMDIDEPEDVVEEIGRLYGFDKLPRELPCRSTKPAPKNRHREIKHQVRQFLSRAGANEVLTYSFVHERVIKCANQSINQAFKLSNALSPDLQYYRLSVLPSLLDKVHANIKAGHDEFVLFEIGKGHQKNQLGDDGLPAESSFVDAVYASKKDHSGAPYFHIRKLAQRLMLDFGLDVKFTPIENEIAEAWAAPFDQKRSALIQTSDGQIIGLVGELRQSVLRGFKLPQYTAAITLQFDILADAASADIQHYQPLSNYPATIQDISLKTSTQVSYLDLFSAVRSSLLEKTDNDIEFTITPLSIYQAADDTATKTTTFRIKFVSHQKTLRDQEVGGLLKTVETAAIKKFN